MTKKIAFVFPGQGSQAVGMLGELASHFPIITETFAEASQVLGYDLWQLTQQGPEELLNQTERTQPALLAAGVAVWRVWQQQTDILPVIMAGHSLGEYTALVCARTLAFTDAIKLVAARGRYMQTAVPANQGAMAAIIGLENSQVDELCKTAAEGEVLSAANFNAPGQVVIAGHVHAVERGIAQAKAAGAKLAMRLAVSVPSHCELMRPAAEQLTIELHNITVKLPAISVLHNVDITRSSSETAIKDALIRQLYCPVRWVDTIEHFAKEQIDLIIECGPGRILTGLNKRINAQTPTLAVFDSVTLARALQEAQ